MSGALPQNPGKGRALCNPFLSFFASKKAKKILCVFLSLSSLCDKKMHQLEEPQTK